MKKSLILTSLALTALSFSSVIQAKEVAGVEVAEKLDVTNAQLQLNGAGVRSKFFMDLYVGSLYLPAPQTELDAVLAQPHSVVRLNITSGMITSEKMQDAINEGFELATKDDVASIQTEVDTFMTFLSHEIVEGDQFTFVTQKDMGVTTFKNGQQLGVIEGEAFRQALLKIWLGDKPAQKSLRKKMLNK
ncbi:chalcone isomerase [Shewanella sp. WXL01]|uniref:chalcone isomerase family protein n=1 Tax=Shewanella sp. WXL01 TaxID=2709721 RepID=UPI0014386B3C|nr:chalcone isomerase family protein [Shewanella sp. WXL01]NKF51060.1 chalcone isomerase [Shewanella sp. WXL01]